MSKCYNYSRAGDSVHAFHSVIFRLALLYAFNRSNEFHSTPKLDVSGVPGHLELNGTEEGEEVWTMTKMFTCGE